MVHTCFLQFGNTLINPVPLKDNKSKFRIKQSVLPSHLYQCTDKTKTYKAKLLKHHKNNFDQSDNQKWESLS